ncbi:hypothetical protein OQA88_9617 [Cercophora sp. LCS_1]
MFPNFTGNSRKTRNVNLSGQRTVNPFTSTSWSSGAPSGASQTVAQAQAERRQRQRERDRLKAAIRIQRAWRAYYVRRDARAESRQLLDQLYSGTSDAVQRSKRALPLLLSVFQPFQPDDHQRLRQVAQDLIQTHFGAFTLGVGAVDSAWMTKLARVLLASLERLEPESLASQSQLLLVTLNGVLQRRPESFKAVLAQYYEVLGRCCHHVGSTWESLDLVREAVVAPLIATQVTGRGRPSLGSFKETAYHQFAVSFFSQRDLVLFEHNITSFVSEIDIDRLSEAVFSSKTKDPKLPERQTSSLWLLAHFIALQKARKLQTVDSRHLKTLYFLLCASSSQIRDLFSRDGPKSGVDREKGADLPSYISTHLTSLVEKDEISSLLERFTANHGNSPDSEAEDASFLAGYILTLMFCFPSLGDDIRMRLYLADISTPQGPLPAVKFFWNAMFKTPLFSAIETDEDGSLKVFQNQRRQAGSGSFDSKWHRDWRTTLLFLELYVFVLRLTDDDDFFSVLNPSYDTSASRLRASGLTGAELKKLTRYLKHLAFTLYYYPTETLLNSSDSSSLQELGNEYSAAPSHRQDSRAAVDAEKVQSFVITAGIEFTAFRSLVSTAMKMLYERDSRRPFLPADHWLMTAKFDMSSFVQAVVAEESRRRELEAQDEDDEDGDAVDDDDEMDIDEPPAFTFAGQLRSRHARIEQLRARQRKDARERVLAANGPKLEILKNMPFVIPFSTRVKLFRQFVLLDMNRRRDGNVEPDRWRFSVISRHGDPTEDMGPGHPAWNALSRHKAQITRGHVFEDAMQAFWSLNDGLKEPIQITFVDEFGMEEAGVDGGGVTKEFLTSVTRETFDQNTNLFVSTSKNSYYPNPCAVDQQKEALRAAGMAETSSAWRQRITRLYEEYEFLGRIIGKCMYEGILIDIVFAGFFLLKWASASSDSYRANINDLRELDEELYQGMMRLKNYMGDVSDLGLDFTIADQVSLPGEPIKTVTRNLVPNGENIAVTNENRPLYISYVARHRLIVQAHSQTRAFLRGLGMIIEPAWLSMFNQNELQRLVGGDNSEIDVEDLRRNTEYSGVYSIGDDNEEHPTIKLFWKVMHELDDEARRDVLKYVTSTPRAPLLGFSQLKPAFSIRDGGGDEERLPSASTCVNLLKLPRYSTAERLKEKLLYAVKSGAGFDLS